MLRRAPLLGEAEQGRALRLNPVGIAANGVAAVGLTITYDLVGNPVVESSNKCLVYTPRHPYDQLPVSATIVALTVSDKVIVADVFFDKGPKAEIQLL